MTTLHLINAFTATPFSGNPAAVCVLQAPVSHAWMQLMAREMNLSETAFLHPVEGAAKERVFALRWFTPVTEVALCGHATLASAFTLWETGVLGVDEPARFDTRSGRLTCTRAAPQGSAESWISMDFPAKVCTPCAPPEGLAAALGCELLFCGNNGMDYLVEVRDETILRALRPEPSRLAQLPVRGVIVTCRSQTQPFDFVSRFFAPGAGIDEDPVTGSAHCALGPYWSALLHKTEFTAFQASLRGGVVRVRLEGERVLLGGQAVAMGRVQLLHSPF